MCETEFPGAYFHDHLPFFLGGVGGWGHGGAVVTHSPPTSEVSGSNPEPYVGKLVVSYQWSAVYSTET